MEWPNRMAAEANSLRTVGLVFGLYTLSPSTQTGAHMGARRREHGQLGVSAINH